MPNKKSKKRKLKVVEDDEPESNGGRFVKAPKYSDDDEGPHSQKVKAKKNRKRKQEEDAPEVPVQNAAKKQKKIKETEVQSNAVDSTSSPSFVDKLRENLKGSRFRFLNEQMYKTTGSDAQKLFKEDSTAFEAYHEGYRHQIAQWPMNPLDRIINGIKRM